MLTDRFERIHDYLRISVTERCDLRCTYCMPEGGVALRKNDAILTADEIETLAKIFINLGVHKIRITGGEPLIRKDIDSIFSKLGNIEGLQELALSTNGTHLEKHLSLLHDSGLRQINISLDTLQPERFEKITRRTGLEEVISAINAAAVFRADASFEAFESIKINAVIMRSINDDELLDFIDFGERLAHLSNESNAHILPTIEIRFIEYMPFPGNHWQETDSVSYNEMREKIEAKYHVEEVLTSIGVRGPAKRFHIRDKNIIVGFITSVTDNFCGDCNRLRITADGMLRTCLFGTDSVNLRNLLRSHASIDTIESAIRNALYEKWERHPDSQELVQINDRNMIMIGG